MLLTVYSSAHMKRLYSMIVITAAIIAVVYFDAMIVFLLSGFIPGINITLAPSTMIAVMVASSLLIVAASSRQTVYRYCLAIYDTFNVNDKTTTPQITEKPKLSRQRYQEL